jgi:hypothetical protein
MIDVGERWAAVLGLTPVLDRELPRILVGDVKRVNDFESEITELVVKLMSGSKILSFPSVPSYKSIGQKINAPVSETDIVKMIGNLPDSDKDSYKSVAIKQFTAIQAAYPRSSMETLTGPVPLRPTDMEVFDFDFVYRVIDDPLYVIRLMSGAALLKTQVNAARTIFPTMCDFFTNTINEIMTGKKAANASYQVPWKADISIRDWLGIPMLIAPYQATFFDAKQKLDRQPQPSTASVSPESKSSISAAQSAMYRSIGK